MLISSCTPVFWDSITVASHDFTVEQYLYFSNQALHEAPEFIL